MPGLRLCGATLLAAACALAQAPEGRWDGSITVGGLPVPFRVDFEKKGAALTGAFVNGDARVASSFGSFDNGVLRLRFERLGTELEATLTDGSLKGRYGDAKRGLNAFSAMAYCTCNYEGEAGPAIMGAWEVAGAEWRVTVRRTGEDTLATVSRAGGETGPLSGRFNGAFFTLNYFDGARAAILEIEPQKDGTLALDWKEPGAPARKLKATRARQ